MTRNVVNHQEVENFIQRQLVEFPELKDWISSNLKNYIYRYREVDTVKLKWVMGQNFYGMYLLEGKWPYYFKEPVTDWLVNNHKYEKLHRVVLDSVFSREVFHILDYFVHSYSNKLDVLSKIGYEDAKLQAAKWIEQSLKKKKEDPEEGTVEIVKTYTSGYHWVELMDKRSYEREGAKMRHCVGNYNPDRSRVFSLRDTENKPHVTVEYLDKRINQISGFANGPVTDKTHKEYVADFTSKNSKILDIKEVSAAGTVGLEGTMSMVIRPVALTFLAFQWTQVFAWLGLTGGDVESAKAMGMLLDNPMFKGAIDLGLIMMAGFEWFKFFADFGNWRR